MKEFTILIKKFMKRMIQHCSQTKIILPKFLTYWENTTNQLIYINTLCPLNYPKEKEIQ